MSQIRRFAVAIVLITLCAELLFGQSRTRPKTKPRPTPSAPATTAKRSVTINLIQGEPVTGTFLRADSETVQLEIEHGRLTIKLNEVASIVFNSDDTATTNTAEAATKTAPATVSDHGLPAAHRAYASLRKLADAAQIGLPYPQYGPLLIEVRQQVEEATRAIPESAIKNDINLALEAYTDAGKAWGIIQAKGILRISTEPGASLMKKYDIRPAVNALGQADRLPLHATLSAIWAVAGLRLNNNASFNNQV
jgi:hypothetical protein